MAGAVRPVVLLMLFASFLFVVDGFLDGVYPGSAWLTGTYGNFLGLAYVFAIVNTAVAVMVARGSERSLQSRIGLSIFFLIERPISAFALGPKPIESVLTHFATAGVELLILVAAVRVWRLGRSMAAPQVNELFALEGSPPAFVVTEAVRGNAPLIAGQGALAIGGVALVVAAILATSGIYGGYVPGGDGWSGDGLGWAVYVFALTTLLVSVRALGGERLPLRALIAIALLLFIERSFSPFMLRAQDPIVLGLHALGAFASLALALATAAAIRGNSSTDQASTPTLEAA